MRGKEILIFWFLVLSTMPARLFGANVTYDSRAILIDGKRRVLISGAIHYPRSTPDMWPDLFQKAKDGGLDAIETYVFWNLHEPAPNEYDFTGRKDLVKFVKLAAKAGLYVFLRIGPYVCAEINYGGFPVWLHYIPKIEFRTNNEPFKREMQRFTTIIVDMMKKEKLYASQGGPIILSQIENEYQYVESDFGSGGKDYIKWAASMALSLDTGVPWIMCHQEDAPDPIINTCNDFYCDQFTPNSPNKPKMWTENWTAWPLFFGGAEPYRPAEDVAFAVARFYQRGGTLQNYYMYHGGTNFGRTSGGPFISTSYDYDAPIDEYGLVRQPKWGHLKDLHKAIKLCEPAMVASDPAITSLGSNLEASVYKTESGLCAAFLANVDAQSDATVNFNGNTYHLPAWSVSILPDCKNVVMNTAQINSEVTIPKFMRQSSSDNADCSQAFQSGWSWFNEPIDISNSYAFAEPELFEQINTTADKSDYLWYSVSIEGNETFLQNGFQTALHIESNGHALHAFVNGKLAGSGKGNSSNAEFAIEVPITLVPGRNSINLLSLTVGLKNSGALLERSPAGVKKVRLEGINNGSTLDLSWQLWRYQIGLKGEELGLPYGGTSIFWKKRKHSPSVWISEPTLAKKQPLVWYKSKFDAPSGQDPVALDFTGMGKGEAWVNGQSIGRYWPTNTAPEDGCTDSCDYRGRYGSTKCLKNCGKPSQQFYHVPRSWLKRSGNTLVLFEEMGGDPTQISFARRQIESLCSIISETYPPPVEMWNIDQRTGNSSGPMLSLKCPSPKQVISYIKFASFGTPQGTCGNFSHGSCSSPKAKALSIVQKACIGKKSCSIEVSINTFGNPCSGVTKSLAVEATCK